MNSVRSAVRMRSFYSREQLFWLSLMFRNSGMLLDSVRTPFLSLHGRPEHYDSHRFERVSNIIKQFKLSCSKTNSQFQCMEVRNSLFSSYIDLFTGNTYIMIIAAGENASTPTALTQLNIAAARRHFEKFFPENS